MGEASDVGGTFVVEHLVIHGGGDAGAQDRLRTRHVLCVEFEYLENNMSTLVSISSFYLYNINMFEYTTTICIQCCVFFFTAKDCW